MQKKILVAEDDDGIIQVITMILEQEGYTVLTARDEKEVYALLEREHPDLLLLDISLGGSDGGKLAHSLKQAEATRTLPIVIASANSETKEIAQKAGADDFIVKPFEIDTLLSTIKNFS